MSWPGHRCPPCRGGVRPARPAGVPSTGSRYGYTDVSVGLRDLADLGRDNLGRTDLYLVLDGPVRLATFRVHP